jgi:hypothetical protein
MSRLKIIPVLLVLAMEALAAPGKANRREAATAPADVSGTYSFLREGELLELNLQERQIIGDIQRFGSSDSDRGVLLTHFFDKASLSGERLEFTTKTVHGVYYEFQGRIERGEGKTRADEDYYRIIGSLTEYTSDAAKKFSARKREVTFKSSPDEAVDEIAD